MKISELIKGIEVVRIVGNSNVEVTDIQFDSRRVEEGCLFFAHVGTASDGQTYIKQCVAKGAVAVVFEKEEYIKEYNVGVRECTFDDIVEIDTFRELKELDPVYDV